MKRIPWTDLLVGGGLARGLVEEDPALDGLLAHPPDEAGLLASARIAAERELPREDLAFALAEGLDRLDAPEPAHAAARRLREPGVVTVVAGQQPGLLGGPTLVLAKALGAAAACARLEAAGIAAVPIYWHASEDDDQAEADHVDLRSGAELHRVRVTHLGERRMLSATPIPSTSDDLLDEARHVLGEAADAALAALVPTHLDETLASWSGRHLARWLGALGIVVVEPSTLRALGRPVAMQELSDPGALAAAVEAGLVRMRDAGYPDPLQLTRRALVFEVVEGVRRRFDVADGDYVGDGGTSGHAERLRERLLADPAAVSWNVVTRVLAQDLVLPVAAQLCGPAELGYVAALGAAHAALGIPQPAALLRPGVTLVDKDVARACRRLGVDPADVIRHGEAALPPPPSAPPELDDLRAALAALPEDPTPAVARRRRELERQMELYAAAWDRALAERDAATTRRRAVALAALRPRGALAERSLSPLPWIGRHGVPFLTALRDALAAGGHVLFTEEAL